MSEMVAVTCAQTPAALSTNAISGTAIYLPDSTNEIVSIPSYGDVVVCIFSPDHVALFKTNGDRIPMLHIEKMSDDDLRRLMESKIVYDALTKVTSMDNDTKNADAFTKQLHDIWVNQTNLAEKILSRLEILNAMQDYNRATRVYLANANLLNTEEQAAQATEQYANSTAAHREALINMVSHSGDEYLGMISQISPADPSYYEKVCTIAGLVSAPLPSTHELLAAQNSAANAQAQANAAVQSAANTEAVVSQANETYTQAVQILAQYGISPENNSDDFEFPTLSLKSDIDAERIKNPDLKYLPIMTGTESSENPETADATSNLPDVEAKTVFYLIKYADEGYDLAQFNLGLRYLEGRGVPKDYNKAIAYLKKSADQGNEDAKNELNKLGEQ